MMQEADTARLVMAMALMLGGQATTSCALSWISRMAGISARKSYVPLPLRVHRPPPYCAVDPAPPAATLQPAPPESLTPRDSGWERFTPARQHSMSRPSVDGEPASTLLSRVRVSGGGMHGGRVGSAEGITTGVDDSKPPWRQLNGKSRVNLPQMLPPAGSIWMGVDWTNHLFAPWVVCRVGWTARFRRRADPGIR